MNATAFGSDTGMSATKLMNILPKAVDKLTPDGQLQ
jgi:uncharacterized protein YidB (DUF937 family)